MLCLREEHIKDLYTSLSDCLLEYEKIKVSTPEALLPLLVPVFQRVDDAFQPGVVMLKWLSLNTSACKSAKSLCAVLSL